MEPNSALGKIEISDDVIAEIAGRATLECYGVVGLSGPGLSSGVRNLLSADKVRKGVQLSREGGAVKIELYVVAEYGTNLSEVAHNLMAQVKYAVERLVGIKVASVDVNIQSIKVSR